MSEKVHIPDKNAHPKVVIEESEPIKDSKAPGGEIQVFEISLYDGQTLSHLNYVNAGGLEDIISELEDLQR